VIDCNLDKEDGESSESRSEPSAGKKHSPDGNAQKKGGEEEEKNIEDVKEGEDATAAVSELAKLAKEANINISKTVTPSPDKAKATPEKKKTKKPKSKAFGVEIPNLDALAAEVKSKVKVPGQKKPPNKDKEKPKA
jgi:hypothetical protein